MKFFGRNKPELQLWIAFSFKSVTMLVESVVLKLYA